MNDFLLCEQSIYNLHFHNRIKMCLLCSMFGKLNVFYLCYIFFSENKDVLMLEEEIPILQRTIPPDSFNPDFGAIPHHIFNNNSF